MTIPSDQISIYDIFYAYHECRKHKRNKTGAIEFEIDLEKNLVELWTDIVTGVYEPQPSTVFIVEEPVVREIFAASFRDRIVHHLVIGKLNHVFEKCFIYDSYSCRKGKGTHFGISRAQRFIRRCEGGYVLKIDIRGYFMSINKNILWRKLEAFIDDKYHAPDKELIKSLSYKIIFNDPTKDCVYHSPKEKWNKLPTDKSLFTAKEGCGLPIGNLTSQVFANFYLTGFDHYVKFACKVKNYGRYVDDCIFFHKSKAFLLRLLPFLKAYLNVYLGLKIHSQKIYLQSCSHGVKFLGSYIKPSHTVINHRTINNFKKSLFLHGKIAENHKPNKYEIEKYVSSVNSYLGIMKHYKTFRKRCFILQNHVTSLWLKHIKISEHKFCKINIKCGNGVL